MSTQYADQREYGAGTAAAGGDTKAEAGRTALRALGPALVISCLLLRLAFVDVAFFLHDQRLGGDFSTFYASVTALRDGTSVYAPSHNVFRHDHPDTPPADLNMSHPTFIVLMAPLAYLPPRAALWLWMVVDVIAWVATLVLLVRTLRLPRAVWAHPLALAAAATLPAFTWALELGQIAPVYAPLTILAWGAARRGQHARSAALIGILIAAKLAFLPLAALFLASRRPRDCASLVAGGVGFSLLALPIVGWRAYRDWFAILMHVPHYFLPDNLSLTGIAHRTFPGHVPAIAPFLFLVGAVLAAAATVTWPRVVARLGRDGLFALLLAICLLGSPLAWTLYLIAALPLVMVPLLAWRRIPAHCRVLFALGLAPVVIPDELSKLASALGSPVVSTGTITALGIALVMAGLVLCPPGTLGGVALPTTTPAATA